MRRITTLFAVSTLILAITSAYLYLQLTAERARAHRDAATADDLHGRVARLEQIRAGLETALRQLSPGQHLTAAPPISPNPEQPLPATPSIASDPARETLHASMPPVTEITEEKRLWLTRRFNKSIFRELALSNAEVEALLPVLAQQDLRAAKPLPKGLAGQPQQESQRAQSELAAVLGAEKAERFTALQKLRPARSVISTLRRRLDDSGEPLSAVQQEALLGIMASTSAELAPRSVEGDDPQQSLQQLNTWTHERDQRLRHAAAPALTAAQRQLLEEDDMFRNAMGMRADAIGRPPQAGSIAPAAHVP
jgi:hypothetical protein